MAKKGNFKRIAAADIRRFHPKMIGACPTDVDYAKVANDLLAILEPKRMMFPDGVDLRELAVRLALYLEDVISEGPVMRAFNYLCRKLYDRNIPFFPEWEAPKQYQKYYEGEVNFDDVRLLMWMVIQRSKSKDTLINPHTPGLAMIAIDVFDYLDDNFEKQPINPMLDVVLHVMPDDPYKGYLHCRLLMEWILTENYLLAAPDVESMLASKRETVNAYFSGLHDKKMIDYAALSETIFTEVCGPLSLFPRQWLGAMMKVSG